MKKALFFGGISLFVCVFCLWSLVGAGDLNPPGIPSGTMRTLNEIYAVAFEPVRVPIDDGPLGDMFLYVDGIPGESTAQGHENWITLSGYTLHVENGAPPREGQYPKFSNLLIAKRTDSASVPLMLKSCDNGRVEQVIVERSTVGEQPLVYYRLTLFDPRVTYISPVSAHTSLYEVVSFGGFTKIRWEYRKQDEAGQPGPWQTEEWDIPRNGGES